MELADSKDGKLLCRAFKLGKRKSGCNEEMLLGFIDLACIFTEIKKDNEDPLVIAGKIIQIEPNDGCIKVTLATGAELFFSDLGGWTYTSPIYLRLNGDLRLKKDFSE